MKYTLIIVTIFAVMFGVYSFLNNNSENSNNETVTAEESAQTTSSTDNSSEINDKLIIGNPDAPATIIEYVDYKCPACNQFHRTVANDIQRDYIDTNKANFEIRITPIFGPDSGNAGRGAYCANEQQLFLQYHNTVLDYIYNNYYSEGNLDAEFEDILTTDKLSLLMEEFNIDQQVFSECTNSARFNSKLDENLFAAADDSVRGTPGFKIGDQSFVGGQPYTVFKTLLDIELQ